MPSHSFAHFFRYKIRNVEGICQGRAKNKARHRHGAENIKKEQQHIAIAEIPQSD